MKNKIIYIIIAVIFAAGVIGSIAVMTAPSESVVKIVCDGEVRRTIDLSAAQDEIFELTENGCTNVIEIRDHRIHMLSADCPDQTCVRMGWLKSASMPIVCLPHHVVIEYEQGADDVDAVTR